MPRCVPWCRNCTNPGHDLCFIVKQIYLMLNCEEILAFECKFNFFIMFSR